LLHENEAPYLQKVLNGEAHPAWLREFPYPIPESFGLPNERVRVFEVLPSE
jgi:hypothetical protein